MERDSLTEFDIDVRLIPRATPALRRDHLLLKQYSEGGTCFPERTCGDTCGATCGHTECVVTECGASCGASCPGTCNTCQVNCRG